jgi:hypothetical protein
MSDTDEEIQRETAGDAYRPEVIEEPDNTRPDKGHDDSGLSSTLAAGTDVDQLRDGGPPPEHGVMTTTGGTAGPNSFRTRPRSGPGVANTTTGDATTGALQTPANGPTSDTAD